MSISTIGKAGGGGAVGAVGVIGSASCSRFAEKMQAAQTLLATVDNLTRAQIGATIEAGTALTKIVLRALEAQGLVRRVRGCREVRWLWTGCEGLPRCERCGQRVKKTIVGLGTNCCFDLMSDDAVRGWDTERDLRLS